MPSRRPATGLSHRSETSSGWFVIARRLRSSPAAGFTPWRPLLPLGKPFGGWVLQGGAGSGGVSMLASGHVVALRATPVARGAPRAPRPLRNRVVARSATPLISLLITLDGGCIALGAITFIQDAGGPRRGLPLPLGLGPAHRR